MIENLFFCIFISIGLVCISFSSFILPSITNVSDWIINGLVVSSISSSSGSFSSSFFLNNLYFFTNNINPFLQLMGNKSNENEDLDKHNELIKDTLEDLQDQIKNKKAEKKI